MKPDFPQCLISEFREEYDIAHEATEIIIACSTGCDFTQLTRHSPGLKGFNWENYLQLSSIRMVRALRMIRKRVEIGSEILDFGSYFGNFSLMLALAGYKVSALDSYDVYGSCFQNHCDVLRQNSIEIMTFKDYEHSPDIRYHATLLMGVIEHIPHTPRLLLEGIHQKLRPSGLLVLDTPNISYIYNRQKLARGESIHPSIQSQYWTDIPFEGHHREFTEKEVLWMLTEANFQPHESELFNYSLYGLSELTGVDFDNYNFMMGDPQLRELQIHSATSLSITD